MAKGTSRDEFAVLSGSKREFRVGLNVETELSGSLSDDGLEKPCLKRLKVRNEGNCLINGAECESGVSESLVEIGKEEEVVTVSELEGKGQNEKKVEEEDGIEVDTPAIAECYSEELRDYFIQREKEEEAVCVLGSMDEDTMGNVGEFEREGGCEKGVVQLVIDEGTRVDVATPVVIEHGSKECGDCSGSESDDVGGLMREQKIEIKVEDMMSDEKMEKVEKQLIGEEVDGVELPGVIDLCSSEVMDDFVRETSQEESVSGLVHEEEPEGTVGNLLRNERCGTFDSNLHGEEGTGMDAIKIEHNGEMQDSVADEPVMRLTHSALVSCADSMMVTDDSIDAKIVKRTYKTFVRRCTRSSSESKIRPLSLDDTKEMESKIVKSPIEMETDEITPITSNFKIKKPNNLLEKPLKRFTRSSLKVKEESVPIGVSSESLEVKVEPLVIDYDKKVSDTMPKKPLRRFTRSTLGLSVPEVICKDSVVKPIVLDDDKLRSDSMLKKPMKRFTRSTLAVNEPEDQCRDIEVQIMVPVDDKKENVTTQKKSLKRFTRSTLALDMPEDLCKDPVIMQSDGEASHVDSSHEILKMRTLQTVSTTKRPTKANELLETGLLDGLPIKYIYQDKEIRGTVKDGGVCCFCELCNGCKVITTNEFERHARTRNKHTAYYIYLENGRSLCDILLACKHAPLALLDATIQRATSSLSDETAKICLQCKGDLPAPSIKKVILLCASCSNLKTSLRPTSSKKPQVFQENLACSSVTDNRSSQPLSTPKLLRSSSKSMLLKNDTIQITPIKKLSVPASTQRSLRSSSKSIMLESNNARQILTSKHPDTKNNKRSLRSSSKSELLEDDTTQGNLVTKLGKPILTPRSLVEVRDSKSIAEHDRSRGKLTRKDLGLHKLVFEKDGLPDGAEVAYYARGKKILEGYKQGFGIFCRCCNSEISPSQFEAHAGYGPRRKPYLHIYTSNGVCLHELSISISKSRNLSAKDNDDLCGICAEFGDLLLCDGCPRSFHKECINQLNIPRGKWYCPYCKDAFEKDKQCATNDNAKAAGRVAGVDPIEQIAKRCIRIVTTQETTVVGGCSLCRTPSYNKSRFGPGTVIVCDQCEKEFHVGCLKDQNMADLKELPEGEWFCCEVCKKINLSLQRLIVRGSEQLPDAILSMIRRKFDKNCTDSTKDFDVRWKILSGKKASDDNKSLLSKAVAIFHNRFDPIVDAITGRDLIPCMVFGRSIREQDFAGMYCAVLTVNSIVVSAGLIRILGQNVAELPLVATRNEYQGQGYFQALFACLERLLGFYKVKTLVLPAAEEAEAIWTQKFGFIKMNQEELNNYIRDCPMTVFKGTSMLKKPVPKCIILNAPKAKEH